MNSDGRYLEHCYVATDAVFSHITGGMGKLVTNKFPLYLYWVRVRNKEMLVDTEGKQKFDLLYDINQTPTCITERHDRRVPSPLPCPSGQALLYLYLKNTNTIKNTPADLSEPSKKHVTNQKYGGILFLKIGENRCFF